MLQNSHWAVALVLFPLSFFNKHKLKSKTDHPTNKLTVAKTSKS